MRIALIHALRQSLPPIMTAFRVLWPQPQLMNLLDDSLSADLDRGSVPPSAITARFLALARYAVDTGADAILFTCSAFGPSIDAVKAAYPRLPVLKPNEAMIEQAVAHGGPVGLLASFAPTLASMPSEFPAGLTLVPRLADGALAALEAGDAERHDALAAAAAIDLRDCAVIALAQFSLARAAAAVAGATGRPVLTTPDSAVMKLKSLLT